jgi:hypothetical protein
LNADAQSVPSLADGSLEKSVDAKTSPDLARIHARSAKRKAGASSRDMETADLGQRVEDFLCYSVAEIFLIAFRAEISERQNGDRTNPRFSFLWLLSEPDSAIEG